jgi:hypothetical protein
MQDENQSTRIFSERTDVLAKRLGVPMRHLGHKLDLSPAMLFGYRSGKYAISAKAWAKLERAEAALNQSQVSALEEKRDAATGASVPSRSEIEKRFADLLRAAERVPGGLGWVMVQLELYLRPEQLRALDPTRTEIRRRAQATLDEIDAEIEAEKAPRPGAQGGRQNAS